MTKVFFAIMIALSVLTPCFAQEEVPTIVNDPDRLPTCSNGNQTSGQKQRNPRARATVICTYSELMIGDEPVSDVPFVKAEKRRCQDKAYVAVNQTPGPFWVISYDDQVAWFNECMRQYKHCPNLDCTTVSFSGGKLPPKWSIEIIEESWSNADNHYNLQDITNYCGGWDGCYNVPLNADMENEFTVVRVKAIVRNIQTREELTDAQGNMIVAEARGQADDTSVWTSLFSSDRHKNSNLTSARNSAIVNLVAEVNRKVKGLCLQY